MDDDLLRRCRVCGLEARTFDEIEAFHLDGRSRYGRDNLCKSCHSERVRKSKVRNDPTS